MLSWGDLMPWKGFRLALPFGEEYLTSVKVGRPPIYRSGRAAYGIDRCVPQRRAIESGKIQFHALTHGHYPGRRLAHGVLPGLSSMGFWDARGPQDWGLEPHRNEGIEIVYLETGAMTFTVDSHRHLLRAGHFTITRPWQLHTLGDPNIGPGRLYWLILDVGVRRPNQEWRWPDWILLANPDLHELTRKLRGCEHPVWSATADVASAFRGLAPCITGIRSPGAVSRTLILLNQLLLGMLDALRAQQREHDPALTSRRRTVELFLRDIETNPSSLDERWTLEGMARHCGMGVTAFTEHCHAITNTSPVEHLNRWRLDHAARMLRANPAQSITDIALRCGFGSSQYFATRFRLRLGCSPREYRSGPSPPVCRKLRNLR